MEIANLPEHLRERTRSLPGAGSGSGQFVLYWMHHAVREHENPALEVAQLAAKRVGLPLLVYQGLGGRHRYNADRHHCFILEGARSAHRALAARGVRAVFHLPEDPAARSPLPTLAERAALVVGEDFPAPPFPAWTQRLATRAATQVWLVDCACVVPMHSQPGPFARAFEFRRHNAEGFRQRINRGWPSPETQAAAYEGSLGFEPLNLEQADISALSAACLIDHSIGPIPHTPGGSQAGYAKWARFRREDLGRYHELRNDAAVDWPRGVSRLSPYLHHGHVSPFRIAREASEAGGPGAEKFLDELLVWRELAHNFCFFTEDPERLEALPAWARDCLLAHADDRRAVVYDAETLARGKTGDPLWNLAQRSLLIHGELHNNLRMTWAKRIPEWVSAPTQALRVLLDLNHRYALDGSDPNSYGGLLWALGLFDRPFTPERPVTGRLRPRTSEAHVGRLDVERYAARVCTPASGAARRIAVIGAGLSGLAAARTLQDQGHQVTVFEKSKGRGGRAGTRRIGEVGVDHGAQYFTVRDPHFRRAVQAWESQGIVARWQANTGVLDASGLRTSEELTERWVAVPGMSRIGGHLAHGLDLRLQCRVSTPERADLGWSLISEEGVDLGTYETVLVSAPAPQAAPLLAAAPALAREAASIRFSPCWAVMLGLEARAQSAYDAVFCNRGPLRWVARNDSKPGRQGDVWVIHANAVWSEANLEAPAEWVIAELTQALGDALGERVPPRVWTQAHRWLYALANDPLARGCLWDPALSVGACGDWAQGSRVEGAYLSGLALAGRVLWELAANSREVPPPFTRASSRGLGDR